MATIEMDSKYAPVPSDTRATLRQKTLLGETYVELSPGSNEAQPLAEGGDLPRAQVAPSVQLDEIFRTFDARTRSAFQVWMQGAAGALHGRGEDLSIAIGSLDSFAEEADRALRILDSQSNAVTGLIRNGGEVFTALSERQGQLAGLIRNTERGLRDDRAAQRGPEGAVHGPADVPARVADDAHPPRPVRRRLEPDHHRPEAGGPPARPDLGGDHGPLEAAALVLPGPARARSTRRRRVSRRCGSCSTTTCRRCSPACRRSSIS